jgi:predicted small metal-binding protein
MTIDCDCGHRCEGSTTGDAVAEAVRHAREAHGIDVTPEQVLATTARRSGRPDEGD